MDSLQMESEAAEGQQDMPEEQLWPLKYVEFESGDGLWLYDEVFTPFVVAPEDMMQYHEVPMSDSGAQDYFTNQESEIDALQQPDEMDPEIFKINEELESPEKERIYPCPVGCDKMFLNAKTATRHGKNCILADPSDWPKKSFPCPVNAHKGCDKLFYFEGVAKKHGRICEEKFPTFPCPKNTGGRNGCTKLFSTQDQADRHGTRCHGMARRSMKRNISYPTSFEGVEVKYPCRNIFKGDMGQLEAQPNGQPVSGQLFKE